jgi:hypothetical protein
LKLGFVEQETDDEAIEVLDVLHAAKYGVMDVSDACKLKGFVEENAELKKLLAESILDVSTLQGMLTENV